MGGPRGCRSRALLRVARRLTSNRPRPPSPCARCAHRREAGCSGRRRGRAGHMAGARGGSLQHVHTALHALCACRACRASRDREQLPIAGAHGQSRAHASPRTAAWVRLGFDSPQRSLVSATPATQDEQHASLRGVWRRHAAVCGLSSAPPATVSASPVAGPLPMNRGLGRGRGWRSRRAKGSAPGLRPLRVDGPRRPCHAALRRTMRSTFSACPAGTAERRAWSG
jgi:hypothetical protein